MEHARQTRILVAAFVLCCAVSSLAAAGTPRRAALSEGWRFQPDPERAGDSGHWEGRDFDRSDWRAVAVPRAWDFFDPVMDGYEGVGWYAIDIPATTIVAGTWQVLHFGRANYRATVWVNGHAAGENLCGYTPFDIPLTPHVRSGGSAAVVVRVENGLRYEWLPGATVVEWVQYGGLLEPVELVTTARTQIAHSAIDAVQDGTDARVHARIELANTSDDSFTGEVTLAIAGKKTSAPVTVEAKGKISVAISGTIENPRRWSPESPALYAATVRLYNADHVIDEVIEHIGVRDVQTRGHEILLNGRPLRIRGVNRYGEFAGCGPVATEAQIREDLRAIKACGANFVRVHFPPTPETLRIADEIGLLFMEEVPLNWWRATFRPKLPAEYDNDQIIAVAERALEEIIRRDVNHPSVIAWSMANECQTADEIGVRAMERLLRRAKVLDPSRLVTYVSNADFEKNGAYKAADFVAVNQYFGMWDGEIARNLGEIEARVFEPTRESLAEIVRLFPGKPVVLTEFGTIGVPGSRGDVRFSEDYQAAYLAAAWRAVEAVPEVSGGVVWSWADYRHRAGFTNDFPAAFGPFGLVTLDRRPKRALEIVLDLWSDD